MEGIAVSAVQMKIVRENSDKNIENHIKFATLASDLGSHLVLFPEMSLTGYEREKAASQAFTPDDKRLSPLQEVSDRRQIVIAAGAPVLYEEKLYIGLIIFFPHEKRKFYVKQFLHPGEELFFASRTDLNPECLIRGLRVRFAICYDIEIDAHINQAKKDGADLYCASIFYSKNGIDGGLRRLSGLAREHKLPIVMSNFTGMCWDTESGGQSSIWLPTGGVITSADEQSECLVTARYNGSGWIGSKYPFS